MAEKILRLIPGIDFRPFKLDSTDGFLLTRINGRLSAKDLARETGLADYSVDRAIEKLQKLGIIETVDSTGASNSAAKAVAPAKEERPEMPMFVSISEPKYDPRELDAVGDLPIEQKKRILDLYYRLDDMDHYTLLGVSGEPDKKTIKRAYFELASVMHPDRYFKKDIGSFKAKMEQLFARITEAHDTLTDAAKRAEYDAYIREVATTRGMEAMFEKALEESRKAAEVSASALASRVPTVPDRPPSAPPPPPPPPTPPPPIPTGPSPQEMQARREALARRLTGRPNVSMRPPAQTAPPADPLRFSSSSDAVDALKRRYEERIDSATTAQARKYIEAAEAAYLKNDLVAAAASYGTALKFAPGDVEMAARFQEMRNEADKLLVESYTKQAVYEERSAHWTEAAKNWEKVAKMKPLDARAHERAAHALLKCEGDLHSAAEHAKAALSADPSALAHHVTLAEVYTRAGLSASAKRAAETGLQLDPKNAALLGILKRAPK